MKDLDYSDCLGRCRAALRSASRHLLSGGFLALQHRFYDQGIAHAVQAAEEVGKAVAYFRVLIGTATFDSEKSSRTGLQYIPPKSLLDHGRKADLVLGVASQMALLDLVKDIRSRREAALDEFRRDGAGWAKRHSKYALVLASTFPYWETLRESATYSGPPRDRRQCPFPIDEATFNMLWVSVGKIHAGLSEIVAKPIGRDIQQTVAELQKWVSDLSKALTPLVMPPKKAKQRQASGSLSP